MITFLAVDGNRNQKISDNVCILTLSNKRNWWSVDLLRIYNIVTVIIYNIDNAGMYRV